MKKIVVGVAVIFAGLLALFLVYSFVGSPGRVGAAIWDVNGWAWSENIGWISLNCANQGSCGDSDYGVTIDDTTGPTYGLFSGEAWSSNIGWISFDQADLAGCPAGDCWAKMDVNTGDISGWARALSPIGEPEAGGWDGWIKLRGTAGDGTEYGVKYINAGELLGWAWGGDADTSDGRETIGWISFSAKETPPPPPPPPPPTNDCTVAYCQQVEPRTKTSACNSDVPLTCGEGTIYYVDIPGDDCGGGEVCVCCGWGGDPPIELINNPPTASDFATSLVQPCSTPAQQFSYIFHDILDWDNQGAYQLQVDKDGDFSNMDAGNPGNGEVDTGKIASSILEGGTQNINVLITAGSAVGQLDYNEPSYFWRVKVWDHRDGESIWYNGPQFWTPQHMYPNPEFEWAPPLPSEDEIFQVCSTDADANCLIDYSICYDAGNNPGTCKGERFLWTLLDAPPGEIVEIDGDGNVVAGDPTDENVLMRFDSPVSGERIQLQITENISGIDVTCGEIKPIGITIPLPRWKEISP